MRRILGRRSQKFQISRQIFHPNVFSSRDSTHGSGSSLPTTERDALFKSLHLEDFNESELRVAHLKISKLEPGSTEDQLVQRVLKKPSKELQDFPTFRTRVFKAADQLDRRVYLLSSTFFATGLSIGVVIPMLPILVKHLDLTPSEFSVVVSAFAVAKLISGIPAGSFSDTHGRKSVIIFGTAVVGAGITLIGFTLSPALGSFALAWLIGARLLTGVGHAFFTSGGLNYVSDVSNARNRARSLAPISSAIHAGLMLGPVLGGLLVEQIGIQSTYFAVGLGVLSIAFLNRFILKETFALTEVSLERQKKNPFAVAFQAWRGLIKGVPELRDILGLNLAYWLTLAGGQFCLLPLFMVQLNLGASEIGISFAAMSVVTVVLGPLFAHAADRYGRERMLLLGSALVSVSMITLSHASSFTSLLASLIPLGMGSTILSSVPLAYLSDIVKSTDRPQAISLLRFVGDVGFLAGVSFAGVLSQWTSIEFTMQTTTVFILSGISLFFLRFQKRNSGRKM